jgi:hypothetical protein
VVNKHVAQMLENQGFARSTEQLPESLGPLPGETIEVYSKRFPVRAAATAAPEADAAASAASKAAREAPAAAEEAATAAGTAADRGVAERACHRGPGRRRRRENGRPCRDRVRS